MLTATVRHDDSMSLSEVRSAVSKSWRKAQRRKSWRAIRGLIDGQVVAPEVTVGRNGWHPHLHVLLFVKSGVLQQRLDELLRAFVDDWRQLVSLELGVSPSVERGVHLLHFGRNADAAAANYLSKIAKELTGGDLKSGRDPFALLDGVADGDAQSIARWIEFCDAMRGRQSIAYSKGLKALLGVDEKTDEEIADEDDDLGLVVGRVRADIWNDLVRAGQVGACLEERFELVRALGVVFVADRVT
jgi:hypothetical protein